jgi:hypothetical protein
MGKTRIRWRNVARLAAGAAVAALLVALTGAMLKPKAPQPLPADVGLDGIRGQAIAYAPPERADRADPRPPKSAPVKEHRSPPAAHHRQPAPPPPPHAPPALTPAVPAATPPPPPPPTPVPAPEPPANEPPAPEPTPPDPPSPPSPPQSHAPSQFGFEQ